MPRLVLVSHRLPVTVTLADGSFVVHPSSGGLATALAGPHAKGDATWVGYPGAVPSRKKKALDALLASKRCVAVHVPPRELGMYYDGFSNGVLWPLFHYLVDKVRLDATREFEAYRAVNERFADAVSELVEEGDTVWVHDYQLMLLPELLRARSSAGRIGFFLHIPFPASEVFRTLPWREEVLLGLLGADLIGFQTANDRRGFARSVSQVLGTDFAHDFVVLGERRVSLGVHPIAIDHESFATLARSPEIETKAAAIRADAGHRSVLLGVDRLDYTKGITRRLLSIDRLLDRNPELRDRVRYVQIAIPSRENVPAYAELRRSVDELVGRINGKHGSHGSVPIHLLHRSIGRSELVALYRASDVMLVTPLRDGMNLVAKEYVASRVDDDGVLVLSEFAGAAAELTEAIKVNPFDIEGTAIAIERALALDKKERTLRMSWLRERVARINADEFCARFLDELGATSSLRASPAEGRELHTRLSEASHAEHRLILLDYDGTLVPFSRVPALASPTGAVVDFLRRLAANPSNDVHVVSGRDRNELERWLGELPITLHAEHGLATRKPSDAGFTTRLEGTPSWMRETATTMLRFVRTTPGSHLERKPMSLAFHYRNVDPDLVAERLPGIEAALEAILPKGAELLRGACVLEARPDGVNKGTIARNALANAPLPVVILAAGDDLTDEDLFGALPRDAITIHVGRGPSRAAHHVASPEELRAVLEPWAVSTTSSLAAGAAT